MAYFPKNTHKKIYASIVPEVSEVKRYLKIALDDYWYIDAEIDMYQILE